MSEFWFGFMMAQVLNLTIQQLMGKEKYLQAAGMFWTNEPWWIWPLMGLILCFLKEVDRYLDDSIKLKRTIVVKLERENRKE